MRRCDLQLYAFPELNLWIWRRPLSIEVGSNTNVCLHPSDRCLSSEFSCCLRFGKCSCSSPGATSLPHPQELHKMSICKGSNSPAACTFCCVPQLFGREIVAVYIALRYISQFKHSLQWQHISGIFRWLLQVCQPPILFFRSWFSAVQMCTTKSKCCAPWTQVYFRKTYFWKRKVGAVIRTAASTTAISVSALSQL